MEGFLVTVLPRPAHTGVIRGQLSPNLFCVPQPLVCSEKFVVAYDKNENISPQNLKPVYGPGSAKIVSAIRIFFEDHSA